MALLTVTTLSVVAANSATAAELQWQRGRTPAAQSVAQRNLHFQRRHDPAVRTAAFEDEGRPQLASGQEGSARLRSVVVNRDKAPDAVRSAQLPRAGTGSEAPSSDADAQLEEGFRTPFGDMPEQPPQFETPLPEDGLEIETMPPPDENQAQPPEEAPPQPTERQLFDQPPNTFQPTTPQDGAATLPPPEDGIAAPSASTIEAEREKSQQSCSQGLADLRAKTIGIVDLSIAVSGTEGEDFPYECSIDEGTWHGGRCWPQTTYLWKASALCHKPLYFEDEPLERYGHSFSPCFQPFISGAHFFTRLPILPYSMGVEPPCECIYALGHYRPGSCAPYMCNPVPLSWRGALFQAGAVVGTAAVLP